VRVDEHTITLDHAPVFYRSAPSEGTPPLYLHGVPTSSDDWIPFLEQTGGLAPDLLGFGRSAKAANLNYSIDGWAHFLERFLAEISVERVELVAHDWGAGGGLRFAQRNPDRIERIVLINALPLVEGFRWPRLARSLRARGLGELVMGSTSRSLLTRNLRKGVVREDAWPSQRLDGIWQQFDQGTQRAILRLFRSTDAHQLAAAGRDLDRLEIPVLILWGAQDPWLPVELGERYAERLPKATLERIGDAGHWPWLDQPTVVERVADFVGG
jgi:pimeloyl-ACP methyl ester carboxylesterase